MKLLTFLGVGRYDETSYTWQDQAHNTRYAPAASCRFLKPDELIVFLTQEAKAAHYDGLVQALPDDLSVTPVEVPLGKDEDELWQIFSQISRAVQPGETVAFDITHGLRSFPLIGLLAAAFLRSGLDVQIRAVLYGAYDVGKALSSTQTPMFDLSPMIGLLEWAVAADRFNRTGDARYFASLMKTQRNILGKAAGKDKQRLEQVGQFGNLAGAFESISHDLRLIRPYDAMQSVAQLSGRIQQNSTLLQDIPQLRPLTLLLEQIEQAYAPLALTEPNADGQLTHMLTVERQMIAWYREREQWVQAVSLAREWLLSWVMVRLGITTINSLSERQRVERVLGSELQGYVVAKSNQQVFRPIFLSSLPDVDAILGLWSSLTDTRNDIDHAGKREEPKKAPALIKQVNTLIDQLFELEISPP